MQQKPTENGTGQPYFHASLVLDKPVMVLTRASIRLSKLVFFEKSGSSQQFRGLRWISAVDCVGEWPLIQQATPHMENPMK
jgi:hypothetical protein